MKSLIDRRHSEMEAIFVRLMELQVDYFRINSGLVDGFCSNIEFYRRSNPKKGSRNNKPSQSTQNNDTFATLDTPPISEARLREDYKKSPDSNKSSVQQDRKENSNKPLSKASSPQVNSVKNPSRNSVDEDILNFDQPKQAPKSQPKAEPKPEKPIMKDDDDDDFLGLGNTSKSPEVAGKKTAPNSNHSIHSSSNINISITSPKNDDPFGFLLPNNNNPRSYSAPPSPLQNNYDAGLDDLFSKPPPPRPTTINNKDRPSVPFKSNNVGNMLSAALLHLSSISS